MSCNNGAETIRAAAPAPNDKQSKAVNMRTFPMRQRHLVKSGKCHPDVSNRCIFVRETIMKGAVVAYSQDAFSVPFYAATPALVTGKHFTGLHGRRSNVIACRWRLQLLTAVGAVSLGLDARHLVPLATEQLGQVDDLATAATAIATVATIIIITTLLALLLAYLEASNTFIPVSVPPLGCARSWIQKEGMLQKECSSNR